MRITTKLDFKTYYRFTLSMTYRRFIMVFATILAILWLIGSSVYFFGYNTFFVDPPYFLLVVSLIILSCPIWLTYSAKKHFNSNLKLKESIVYEFYPDIIKMTGESFHSEMSWSTIYKVVETKKWILIYQSRTAANLLRISDFEDKLDEFKALVKETKVKATLSK